MTTPTTITRVFNATSISHRTTDGYFNATAMCKAASVKWNDYWRNQKTQDFLAALGSSLNASVEASAGIPANERYQTLTVSKPGDPANGGGTWVHPQVAYHLAMWCSPAFAVRVTEWISDIATKGYTTANRTELDLNDPSQLRQLLLDYTDKVVELQTELAVAKPKAEYMDNYMASAEDVPLRMVIRELYPNPNRAFEILREDGLLDKRCKSNVPTKLALEKGLFRVLEGTTPLGQKTVDIYVTPTGRIWLLNIFTRYAMADAEKKAARNQRIYQQRAARAAQAKA